MLLQNDSYGMNVKIFLKDQFLTKILTHSNDFYFLKDIFSTTIYNNMSKFLRAFYHCLLVMTVACSL